MKTISGPFLTMLQTTASLVEADLYTITLASGTVLRYTSAQNNVINGALTYYSSYLDSNPTFQRGQTKTSIGVNADDLEVDILFDSSSLILGQIPAAFAAAGGFDNATIQVDKALAPDWSNPVVNGVVNLFTGIVAEAKCDSGKVALTVNSQLRRLNTSFPRNYFLPQCNHSLFDSGCALSKAAYAVAGTVASGGASLNGFNSNATQADGWFALGYVVWLTGANAGLQSSVKAYAPTSGAFQLIYPLDNVPAVGDTFTAYPGCDKTQTTCTAKFNNLTHFRGFPYVPTPETLELGSQGSPPGQAGGSGGAGVGGAGGGGGGIGRGPGGTGIKMQ